LKSSAMARAPGHGRHTHVGRLCRRIVADSRLRARGCAGIEDRHLKFRDADDGEGGRGGPPFLRLGVDEAEAARLGCRGRTHRRRGDLIGVSIQRRPIVNHVATCPAENGTTTDASVFGKRARRTADSILLKQVLTGFPAAERAKVLHGDS